jgi:hypothetical protein
MGIRDLVAADTARLISTDEFGEAVTLRHPDGTESSLTAIVFDEITETRDVRGLATIVSTRNITVAGDDIADLNLRSTVIIGDDEWSLVRIIYRDEWQATLELQRYLLHEHTRPGYRQTP